MTVDTTVAPATPRSTVGESIRRNVDLYITPAFLPAACLHGWSGLELLRLRLPDGRHPRAIEIDHSDRPALEPDLLVDPDRGGSSRGAPDSTGLPSVRRPGVVRGECRPGHPGVWTADPVPHPDVSGSRHGDRGPDRLCDPARPPQHDGRSRSGGPSRESKRGAAWGSPSDRPCSTSSCHWRYRSFSPVCERLW